MTHIRFSGLLLRFLGVGGCATLLQYGLLVLQVQLAGMPAVAASAACYAASTLFNYAANHRLTFRSRRAHHSALPRFLLVAALGLGINTLVMWFAHEHGGRHYLVAQLLATAASLCWNFLACRHWAFATPDEHEETRA